jgi:hypothetical protein
MPVGMCVTPHGRVGGVDALPALARGAVHVDPDLALRDLDLDVLVDLGDHVDGAERGVPALVRVERADPHEAVDAALGLRVAVGVLALEQQRRLGDARPGRRPARPGPRPRSPASRPSGCTCGRACRPSRRTRSRPRPPGSRGSRCCGRTGPSGTRRSRAVELLAHGRDGISLELPLVGLALGGVRGLDQLDHDVRRRRPSSGTR